LDAPHTSNALLLDRFETAKASGKNPVDAGPTQNDFFVETVLERFMDQHSGESYFARAHVELVRDRVNVWCGFGFDLETFIL
jgi:hypothetical protein